MKAVYLKDKTGNKIVTTSYYRVGDLFLTTIATNPSNYLGGKWELFGPGRCLVCVDTSDGNFNTVKKTGGNKVHKHISPLTWVQKNGQYALGVTNDLGSDKGVYRDFYGNWTNTVSVPRTDLSWEKLGYHTTENSSLQPYITCYVWIRTA